MLNLDPFSADQFFRFLLCLMVFSVNLLVFQVCLSRKTIVIFRHGLWKIYEHSTDYKQWNREGKVLVIWPRIWSYHINIRMKDIQYSWNISLIPCHLVRAVYPKNLRFLIKFLSVIILFLVSRYFIYKLEYWMLFLCVCPVWLWTLNELPNHYLTILCQHAKISKFSFRSFIVIYLPG